MPTQRGDTVAEKDRVLVVSAHAADFCIRAGGTLVRHVSAGEPVRVLVMSPGARGESNELWRARKGQISEPEVAAVRRKEAEQAAAILGVDVIFFDYPDQPLTFDRDRLMVLVREIRAFRPSVVLTHPRTEPYNPDHSASCLATLEATYYATLAGVEPDLPVITPVQILAFEPTQPMAEATGFVPDTFIDITDVMDVKMRAVAEYKTQPYHVDRYRARAAARGAQAAYLSGNPSIQHAEAFQRYTPWVGRRLP
jgi:4-oxalomesaconate hydratase